jgi:riboflavin kinase/FMN adenylyltransferase
VNIYRDITSLPKIKNAVVTTGSFDGVHIGHQALISRLVKLARSIDGETVLITFYPHVRKVLYPDTAGKDLEMINSQKEKIELLSKTGLDNLVIINFTPEFAKTTAEDFVRNLLSKKLGAKIIVVGYNHYFGHNKEGDYDKLIKLGQELDFEVVEIPKQELEKETVGSSKIRKSIKDGKIMHANAYLDHIFFFDTNFTPGSEVYRNLGFKTYFIDIEAGEKLIPPDGIYAIRAEIDGNNTKGIMISDYHEQRSCKGIEVLLFDDPEVQNNQEGKVYVHKELTANIAWDNAGHLKRQIEEMIEISNELIY